MNALNTAFTDLVGINHPILQEGMGPFKTARLAAAVSESGGMGTVSMPGLTPDPTEGAKLLRSHIAETMTLTSRPFAVNVPVGRDAAGAVLPVSAAYIDAVITARAEDPAIEAQLRMLTTSAGFPGEFRERIRDAGLVHAHKVGSTHHAVKAVDAGVDIIIASGHEMGGHTLATPISTFILVPNVAESVGVPVILSGGARDGRTLAAALCLGAAGVAMGTRFIASQDNVDWHPAYAESIIAAQEGDDTVFPAIYGPARGLRTAGVTRLLEILESGEMDDQDLARWKDEAMIRAQQHGDVENGLVPAGQVSSAIKALVRVADFVPEMAREARTILATLAAQTV